MPSQQAALDLPPSAPPLLGGVSPLEPVGANPITPQVGEVAQFVIHTPPGSPTHPTKIPRLSGSMRMDIGEPITGETDLDFFAIETEYMDPMQVHREIRCLFAVGASLR